MAAVSVVWGSPSRRLLCGGELKLLDALRVPRTGGGRPRTRPVSVAADKAYNSRGHRALVRAGGIKAVSPEPADQAGHRTRRGPYSALLIWLNCD